MYRQDSHMKFRTAGYDMWSRMEPQNEKLMAAMQQLSLKERFVVTEYVLKGKPFKEIAQETGLKEKGVASAYYRSIEKLLAITLRMKLQVLTDTVEYNHLIIDRVTYHSQDSTDEGLVNLQ